MFFLWNHTRIRHTVSLTLPFLYTLDLRNPMVFTGNSWGFLFLLYFYIQLSRCVVVGILYMFLSRVGYGLDWKESIILIWSGLRGAVALALSLSVKVSFQQLCPSCSSLSWIYAHRLLSHIDSVLTYLILNLLIQQSSGNLFLSTETGTLVSSGNGMQGVTDSLNELWKSIVSVSWYS